MTQASFSLQIHQKTCTPPGDVQVGDPLTFSFSRVSFDSKEDIMPQIAEIRRHPLVSGRIQRLDEAFLGTRGIQFDRWWMAVKPDGTHVNQLKNRKLATIETHLLSAGQVEFCGRKGQEPFRLPLRDPDVVSEDPSGQIVTVTKHGQPCKAVDLGDRAADWISRELGEYVRLVQCSVGSLRPAGYEEGTQTSVAFQDRGSLLIASEASLADLNRRLSAKGEEAVPMDRFRPNLVIGGCEPYEEETWRRIEIAGIEIALTVPSRRCAIITFDQTTGDKTGGEPFRMLGAYRMWDNGSRKKPIFGMNANHRGTGTISVGDPVRILERGEPFVARDLAL